MSGYVEMWVQDADGKLVEIKGQGFKLRPGDIIKSRPILNEEK
jgi:hypothetical protein